MPLLLFDVDGTLTATGGADADAYASAFERAFDFPLHSKDWSDYEHVTDGGIIREAFARAGREPLRDQEFAAFEREYLRALEDEHRANPAGFREVPGARAMIESIAAASGARAALATGGMRATAGFKLRQIGIDAAALPGGYANDAIARTEIALLAIERAGGSLGEAVYIGDGCWDARTCAALGLRFVAVTHESDESALRAEGARAFVRDYADPSAFWSAVEAAEVPRRQ